MLSKAGFIAAPNNEDALRFAGILNDVVGLSLSFIGLRAAYIVLGTAMGISLLFNLVMILAEGRETRIKLKNGEPVRPNMVALGIEIFGTAALFVMYVISLVDTLDWDYNWWSGSETFVHAYAGVTGMIAL